MKEFKDKLISRLEEEKQRLRKLRNNTVTLTDYEVCAIEEGAFNFCKKAATELAEEYKDKSNDEWKTIYDKVCNLEREYADNGKMEDASRCIKLENYLQYFKEELQSAEEYKVSEMPTGWIPCSERLPSKEEYLKDGGRFIVTDGNRCYQSVFDIYSQVFRTSVFGAFGSYRYEEDKCVIAWMPLPAPFKEGE